MVVEGASIRWKQEKRIMTGGSYIKWQWRQRVTASARGNMEDPAEANNRK